MWDVYEHGRVAKQLRRLPRESLKRYEKWKDIAAISGPPGLRLVKGFHDEALSGRLGGLRSSRLGVQYRIICRAVPRQLVFQVLSITPHEYREV